MPGPVVDQEGLAGEQDVRIPVPVPVRHPRRFTGGDSGRQVARGIGEEAVAVVEGEAGLDGVGVEEVQVSIAIHVHQGHVAALVEEGGQHGVSDLEQGTLTAYRSCCAGKEEEKGEQAGLAALHAAVTFIRSMRSAAGEVDGRLQGLSSLQAATDGDFRAPGFSRGAP